MYALVTGASAGIGMEIAKYLAVKGYDLILTARREDRLSKLRRQILHKYPDRKILVIPADLTKREECMRLFEEACAQAGSQNIDFVVNNAGMGVYGRFLETDLEKELALIDLKSIGLTAQKRKVVVSEMLRLLNKYGMKDRCILLGGSAGRLKGFRDAAEGEADSIPIAAVGTIWPELKALNLPNSFSSYSVTPFGHISGQDYSPLVGRKNRAVDSYHTRVK